MLELPKCEAQDYGREDTMKPNAFIADVEGKSIIWWERGAKSSMRFQRLEHGSSLYVEMRSVPNGLSVF